MSEQRVQLDRGDYYELQTLQLRVLLAEQARDTAQRQLDAKKTALAEKHQFYTDANWAMDDATTSLVAKG